MSRTETLDPKMLRELAPREGGENFAVWVHPMDVPESVGYGERGDGGVDIFFTYGDEEQPAAGQPIGTAPRPARVRLGQYSGKILSLHLPSSQGDRTEQLRDLAAQVKLEAQHAKRKNQQLNHTLIASILDQLAERLAKLSSQAK